MKSQCEIFIFWGKNIKHVFRFQLTSECVTAVKSKCERFIYFGKNIKHVFRFQLTSKCETAVKSKCERFIYFGKKYKTCILFPTYSTSAEMRQLVCFLVLYDLSKNV